MTRSDKNGPDKAIIGLIAVLSILLIGGVYIVSGKKGETPAPETKPTTSNTAGSPEVPITNANDEEGEEDLDGEDEENDEDTFGTDEG